MALKRCTRCRDYEQMEGKEICSICDHEDRLPELIKAAAEVNAGPEPVDEFGHDIDNGTVRAMLVDSFICGAAWWKK